MASEKIATVSIKELIKDGWPKEELMALCDKLYDMTDFISKDYPKHKSWFYQKHMPAVFVPESGRDIVVAFDENKKIYGTAFIKRDEFEKKICTLFVKPESRGLGVGTLLVEKSMEILGTTKPMITFADYKLPMFKRLIEKYDWEKSEEVSGLYNDKYVELVYNGSLTK